MHACEQAELMHAQRFRACRAGVGAELGLGLRGVTSRERTSQKTSSRSRKLRSEHHHVHVISSIEINHAYAINNKYINHDYMINES